MRLGRLFWTLKRSGTAVSLYYNSSLWVGALVLLLLLCLQGGLREDGVLLDWG